MNEHGAPVLYALVTGSPPARDVGKLVAIAQAEGWDVCVIASPDGKRFIDVDALTVKTGHPVYSEYAEFEQPGLLPTADAMIVAALTCNSLAKWAVGISDTLPLGLLVEGVGKKLPIVAMPFSSDAQLSFPAVQNALRRLPEYGVTVLAGDGVHKQHEPGMGDSYIDTFPWDMAWRAVADHPWRGADRA